MIHIEAARKLLDFGARMGEGPRAEEQLQGAVALHNILEKEGIAYLADEVGMGKTYVALGALALFRHYAPDFRVLVIAPRENIQRKWVNELRNFVSNNVRFPDLRVKALDGRPARSVAECDSLLELVDESLLDPQRDFFVRLTSFSLPIAGKGEVSADGTRALRERLLASLPWLDPEVFDLRNKQAFKDNVARAICCALPRFDLVIVDEAHNLKHGYSENVAARNRVLALALGRDPTADTRRFRTYGPRASRILFLSATPVEDSYAQLWNQLDVFGRGSAHEALRANGDDDAKKAHAKRFLIRRVTSLPVAGQVLTKNLYRRDWRRGGVLVHDEPTLAADVRQKLVVALVQKKVSEVLNDAKFNASFQIGMLASFESFLETSRAKRTDEEDASNFDQTEQTDDEHEREGVDVQSLNKLASRYRSRFNHEMPHPKMDAVVARLGNAFRTGEKALVFVRRVASVKELKRKLDERYDALLKERLVRELPELSAEIERLYSEYLRERKDALEANRDITELGKPDDDDRGGIDTYFAWFFRGEPRQQTLSGASVQKRVVASGFFEDNIVAELLRCEPGTVLATLARVLGFEEQALTAELNARARGFLSKSPKRADRIRAVQAAAMDLLKDRDTEYREQARILWRQRFQRLRVNKPRRGQDATDNVPLLEARTFFTELRLRPNLREALWPESTATTQEQRYREQDIRALLLDATARLGHSLIDLFVVYARAIGRLTGPNLRGERAAEGEDTPTARIHEFLDRLEQQSTTTIADRGWAAFDELAELAANHQLILDTNIRDLLEEQTATTPEREVAVLLGRQQPNGGMAGGVSRTLVRQFRMPGYPLVLVTTDLLQEGEDLHTFCSHVHHYGITYTPSAIEQRIGRIDRVRSQSDRRLSALTRPPEPDELLQVYFPHLEDTVEVLQVQRVLHRVNTFLRLMHEGLAFEVEERPKIDTREEFAKPKRHVPRITERLETAFPVVETWLAGATSELDVQSERAESIKARFAALEDNIKPLLKVTWEAEAPSGVLLGTVHREGGRRQPFKLRLASHGKHALVRCVSPVGRVELETNGEELQERLLREPVRIGAVLSTPDTYDLTVEEDVLLGETGAFDAARGAMLIRKVTDAADQLEREELPQRDEPMESFRHQLERDEGHDAV